jgi:hypothetical protein
MLAELGRPCDESRDKLGLLGDDLKYAAAYAEFCLGWIWRQWLLGAAKGTITKQVVPFIERGLELRKRSFGYYMLPQHDLLLLHCAIFASDDRQLERVVDAIADASGDKGEKPLNDGELYAAAWCGMMKYWILGDEEKAMEQSNLIWGAYRDQQFFAAPKPLVTPWLKKDWKALVNRQQKDFDKLWKRARKDGWTVRSESSTEIVVRTNGYQIGHMWCWAHCGMALLANRQGAKVATDPLWFPSHALSDANRHANPSPSIDSTEQQQELF